MPLNHARVPEVQEPFIPLATLVYAFRYWWIAAALMVLGGLVGLMAHSIKPTLYESTAQFSIAVDFVSTGPMTQYDEDLAINTAGNIFISTEVLQIVTNQAGSEGINKSLEDLRAQISIERKFSLWTLRVRDEDPQVAFRLAQIWMEQGQALLLESYQHAVQADMLDRYIQSQTYCFERLGANQPIDGPCNSANFTTIQANLRDAGAALYQERTASRGLFAGLTLGPFNPPEAAAQPVTFGRSQFVFLGGMLGLIIGILVIEIGVPWYRRMKS